MQKFLCSVTSKGKCLYFVNASRSEFFKNTRCVPMDFSYPLTDTGNVFEPDSLLASYNYLQVKNSDLRPTNASELQNVEIRVCNLFKSCFAAQKSRYYRSLSLTAALYILHKSYIPSFDFQSIISRYGWRSRWFKLQILGGFVYFLLSILFPERYEWNSLSKIITRLTALIRCRISTQILRIPFLTRKSIDVRVNYVQ